MKKLAQGFNTAAQDLNLGSRSRESEALTLSHCTLQDVLESPTATVPLSPRHPAAGRPGGGILP